MNSKDTKTAPRKKCRSNSKPAPCSDLLCPADAAALLGVHVITLRRYRHDGKLTATRLPGGGVRYNRADLLGLLEPTID